MFSTTRYLALGIAFAALTGTTIVQTVPRVEADVHRQAVATIENVQHMVISVNGRDVTLRGRMRSASPQQMTSAVGELFDALNNLPAVNRLDAAVDLLSTELNNDHYAAQAASIKRT